MVRTPICHDFPRLGIFSFIKLPAPLASFLQLRVLILTDELIVEPTVLSDAVWGVHTAALALLGAGAWRVVMYNFHIAIIDGDGEVSGLSCESPQLLQNIGFLT